MFCSQAQIFRGNNGRCSCSFCRNSLVIYIVFLCALNLSVQCAFGVFTGVFKHGFTGGVVFFGGVTGVRQARRMAFLGYLK